MDEREEKYKIARKRAKDKIAFLRHLVTYIIVIAFLAVVNNMTWGGYQWWLWAALGWGIGIVSHFFQVYAFKGSLFEDKMIERELEMMDGNEKDYRK
ncbi:MAG TPA: histidine kinase [Spirochaeta sp.]|nr:histidine kinase [Spirochaeta sp.]